MEEERYSLDDKRIELLPPENQWPAPTAKLTGGEHAKSNLPDILRRLSFRASSELKNPRTA